MQIVRDLGGYSYGRSDLVRRAMSKKKMDVMLEEKEYFIHGKLDENGEVEIAGCVRNGIPENVAEEIFNQMVSFAEYAFNKSHAAAYAVVAYEKEVAKIEAKMKKEVENAKTEYDILDRLVLYLSKLIVRSQPKGNTYYKNNCIVVGILNYTLFDDKKFIRKLTINDKALANWYVS